MNPLVRKSIELTLNISGAVVGKLAPIAEVGISAASPLTTKVDEYAAAGLDVLITRMPVINEEPKEVTVTVILLPVLACYFPTTTTTTHKNVKKTQTLIAMFFPDRPEHPDSDRKQSNTDQWVHRRDSQVLGSPECNGHLRVRIENGKQHAGLHAPTLKG